MVKGDKKLVLAAASAADFNQYLLGHHKNEDQSSSILGDSLWTGVI